MEEAKDKATYGVIQARRDKEESFPNLDINLLKTMKAIRISIALLILFHFSSVSSQQTNLFLSKHSQFFKELSSFQFVKAQNSIAKLDKSEIEYHYIVANYFWWKYMTEPTTNSLRDSLVFHLQQSVNRVEKQKNKDTQSSFLQLTTYAFFARLALHEGEYFEAFQQANNITTNIEHSLQNANSSPYYTLTAGLYQYAAGYGKKEYWYLYPYFLLIPDGDEKLGIKMLQSLGNNSELLIKNEANYYLMKIYKEAYLDYPTALIYARRIVNSNPTNLIFRNILITILRKLKKTKEVQNEIEEYDKALESIKNQLDSAQYQYLSNLNKTN